MAEPLDLCVRGGTVVTSSSHFQADIGIRGGRIECLGHDLEAAEYIDASGKLVLPGGIDMHVHLTPVERIDRVTRWADDFASGSRAAAAGGVTTIGNITFPRPSELLSAVLERVSQEASAESIVDFVLHPVVMDPSPDVLSEIPELARAGQPSIKIFMMFDNFEPRAADYLRAMSAAGQAGMITMVHCEDGTVIRFLTEQLLAANQGQVSNYASSRPVYVEEAAVHRAVAFCEAAQAPIYIVHLSSQSALEATSRARARGLPVSVEVRPIYLHFDRERLEGPSGALYIGNPPLRGGGDVAALWHGLSNGEIQTCCSDHAPNTRKEKLDPSLTVATARPGVADLETLLPLLFSEGVRSGRLSLERFVEVTSTNPAKLFGIYPQKGTIAPGSDADLVVWDRDLTITLEASKGQSRADFSLYEGWEVHGWPSLTLSRGRVIFENGRIAVGDGGGRRVSAGRTMWL